jgi:hypothetical protein
MNISTISGLKIWLLQTDDSSWPRNQGGIKLSIRGISSSCPRTMPPQPLKIGICMPNDEWPIASLMAPKQWQVVWVAYRTWEYSFFWWLDNTRHNMPRQKWAFSRTFTIIVYWHYLLFSRHFANCFCNCLEAAPYCACFDRMESTKNRKGATPKLAPKSNDQNQTRSGDQLDSRYSRRNSKCLEHGIVNGPIVSSRVPSSLWWPIRSDNTANDSGYSLTPSDFIITLQSGRLYYHR